MSVDDQAALWMLEVQRALTGEEELAVLSAVVSCEDKPATALNDDGMLDIHRVKGIEDQAVTATPGEACVDLNILPGSTRNKRNVAFRKHGLQIGNAYARLACCCGADPV